MQKRRTMQIAAGVACVVFVGMALGAVVVDRKIEPAPDPTLPPPPPTTAGGTDDGYDVSPPLIASGLSSVYQNGSTTTMRASGSPPRSR